MRSKNQIIIRGMIVASGLILLVAVFLYYYIFNPTESNAFFPTCSFKTSTGFDCVGCGIQRAVYSLLHGNIVEAISYNALFVLLLPLLMYYIFYSTRRFIFGKTAPNVFLYSHKFGLLLIAIIVMFLIIRNLPFEPLIWLNSSK